jgi:hypothetical protein
LREYDLERQRARTFAAGAEGVYSADGKWVAYLDLPNRGALLTPSEGQGSLIQVSGMDASQVRSDGELDASARALRRIERRGLRAAHTRVRGQMAIIAI